MWERKDLGNFTKGYKVSLKTHTSQLIKITPINNELIKRNNKLIHMDDFRENKDNIKLGIILIQSNSLIVKIISKIKIMKNKLKKK